jgi:hypothetical protein
MGEITAGFESQIDCKHKVPLHRCTILPPGRTSRAVPPREKARAHTFYAHIFSLSCSFSLCLLIFSASSWSVSNSANGETGVTAHIIPRLQLGITAFKGADKAAIYLELDATSGITATF